MEKRSIDPSTLKAPSAVPPRAEFEGIRAQAQSDAPQEVLTARKRAKTCQRESLKFLFWNVAIFVVGTAATVAVAYGSHELSLAAKEVSTVVRESLLETLARVGVLGSLVGVVCLTSMGLPSLYDSVRDYGRTRRLTSFCKQQVKTLEQG